MFPIAFSSFQLALLGPFSVQNVHPSTSLLLSPSRPGGGIIAASSHSILSITANGEVLPPFYLSIYLSIYLKIGRWLSPRRHDW